jgi:hypothetical protein
MDDGVGMPDLDLGPEHPASVKEQARWVVAGHSADTAECAMFLAMLGLDDLSDSEPGCCVHCGETLPMSATVRRDARRRSCVGCAKAVRQ